MPVHEGGIYERAYVIHTRPSQLSQPSIKCKMVWALGKASI